MPNFNRPPRYHIYLLTIWEERGEAADSEVAWRFRLEYPGTGRKEGFASTEALMDFLKNELKAGM
ncbi:MAG: hypothetical protein P8Y14_22960 [Anaerolineales bacterium]|jgi:hypothetical protein